MLSTCRLRLTGVSCSERVFLRGLETRSGVSTVIVLRELLQHATKTFDDKKAGLAESLKAPMYKSVQKGFLAGKDLSQPMLLRLSKRSSPRLAPS